MTPALDRPMATTKHTVLQKTLNPTAEGRVLLPPSTMRATVTKSMLGRMQGGEWRGTPSLVAMLVLVLGPQ